MQKRRGQGLALAAWVKRQSLKRQLEGRDETSVSKKARGAEDHIVLIGVAELGKWGERAVAERKGVG